MHRIPLQLPTLSVMWERSLPECMLFERTLNMKNVLETEAFINILDEEAEFDKRQSYGIAEDMFRKVNNCLLLSDPVSYSEGMCIINSIILRAPKDSPVLTWALKIRGHLLYNDACFEHASKVFEMFLHIHKVKANAKEDICEVVGRLVVCLYMMGQHVKAKKYLRQYNKFKAKLPLAVLQQRSFVQIEKQIENFANELYDVVCSIQSLAENVSSIMPLKKLNVEVETDDNIYTDSVIKKTELIFAEDPMLHSIKAPFLRCEVCYRLSRQQIYTCLQCRYKTYCSLYCMEKDSSDHAIECIGYKQLLLIILDATDIFSIFLKIIKQLNEQLFNQPKFRNNITALEIWFNLVETIENNAKDYEHSCLSVLAMKPLYKNLTDTQYSTLVATAFRLTIFIDKKTNLIETYFRRFQVSSKQKLIIVGSLLMRIHCNLLLNTFDFEIRNDIYTQVPNDTQQITRLITSSPKHDYLIKDLNQYYDVDIENEVWQRSIRIVKSYKNSKKITPNTLPRNKHTMECNRIHRILSVYKDNIAELYFNPELITTVLYGPNADQPINPASAARICKRLAEMTDIQRCYFVKKFARLFHNHYTEYFLQIAEHNKSANQVISVYSPTLRQFRHSCDPNVEIIVLDNGVVAAKALRDIKPGEQLCVAYKAHHMRHSRRDRQRFLQQLNINCHCIYCEMSNIDDPINKRQIIYCESCSSVEITPESNECPKCKTQYNNLLIKYRTVINVLENELNNELKSHYTNEMSDRNIYILHLMLYLHAKKYFGPRNEYRINIELKHARYLALKNFDHQSYQLIMEVSDNILQCYDEHFIWFTYYADILLTIKIILCSNNEERLHPISSNTLMQLCDLGLYIVKGQVEFIGFYELFDQQCSSILNDMSLLLNWKDKIACNHIAPLVDSLSNLNRRVKSVSGKNRIPPL